MPLAGLLEADWRLTLEFLEVIGVRKIHSLLLILYRSSALAICLAFSMSLLLQPRHPLNKKRPMRRRIQKILSQTRNQKMYSLSNNINSHEEINSELLT